MELREISREEHELLLNLFILKMSYQFYFEYIDWENEEYEQLMKTENIIVLKDCFPMGEVCEEIREVLITPNSTANAGYIYLPANFIKEV